MWGSFICCDIFRSRIKFTFSLLERIVFVGILVRQMTYADLKDAGLIAMAAYDRPSSDEQILRRYLDLQPDGWYLALLNGKPVGLGGAVDFGPFAYLGMMSVLPTMQKRGIGQALMERLLSWLDARGCPTVLLNARPRAISLYERYGFVTLEQTQQLTLSPPPQSQETVPGVSLLAREELAALAAFDAPAFGASRLAILSDYLALNPQRFLVSRDTRGQLAGFLVARETMLGPWHAASVDAAELLLQQALRLPDAHNLMVSFSETNLAALALLARYGGEIVALLAHMRRGQPLQRDPEQRLYGIASFMLG
jgi:GNAT superfamily N-acetyltransferase